MGNAEIKRQFDTNIRQLATRSVEETHISFWGKLWSRDLTVENINSNISAKDIREIRTNQTENFNSLIRNTINKLRAVLRKNNLNENFQCTRNCLALLTRILPVAFEDVENSNKLFWELQEPLLKDKEQITVKEDKEGLIEDVSPSETPKIILGQILLDTLVDLLFLDNFTISLPKQKLENTLSNPIDYSQGILNPVTNEILAALKNCTKQYVTNRGEVLLCLIACFSSALYNRKYDVSNDEYNLGEGIEHLVYFPNSNKWVEYVATSQTNKMTLFFTTLLFSATSYDPIGWGVPYNHILVYDPHEQQMERSLQVLAILLEYRVTVLPASHPQSQEEESEKMENVLTNIFSENLSLISNSDDYSKIWMGLITILNNPLIANNTYFPYSTKLTSARQEMFIMFWNCLLINKGFLDWGLLNGKIIDVTYPIVYYLHEGRKDQPQLGMVHLGIFILYFLSGSRDFSVSLNTKFNKKPKIDMQNQNLTYADFVVVTLVKLIWDGHVRLNPLRECCLTILANISPYIKSLSSTTTTHLLKMFSLVTRPQFLFANETNYRYCFFLLETFNNILQYQYAGNSHLVYAIIRNKNIFKNLKNLKIEDELKEENEDKTTIMEYQEAKGTGILEPPPPHYVPSPPPLESQPPPEEPEVRVQQHDVIQVESKFVPATEWLDSWQKQLPIMTIIRFLQAIVPRVKSMVTNTADDESKILAFLESTTMVGILPLPHPIILRKFWPTSHALNWFHCYMWGVIFLKCVGSGTTFIDTDIKLFLVHIDKKDQK